MSAKIGRNDPCPCGSGRKHKQCCLPGAVPVQDRASASYNLGIELESRGRFAEAAASYRAALKIRPDFVEALINLGNVLDKLKMGEDALKSYRHALELRPELLDLHLNLGATLQELGRAEEAIASYQAALRHRPDDAGVHNNLGLVLRTSGRLVEAEEHFLAALKRAPADADIHHGLADTLMDLGRWDEAMVEYRRSAELGPHTAKVMSGALMMCLYDEKNSRADLAKLHSRFADRFESPLSGSAPGHRHKIGGGQRLKVGYVSADLRSHSVAYFIEPILACHDREHFEIHCYYNADNSDAATQRLRDMSEHWHECARWSDEQLDSQIRADGIDILVDLSGHTAGNRMLTFARRPAPVQVTWIGYPCATGLRQIDYFFSDRVISTESTLESVSPAVATPAELHLPRIFSCYRAPAIAPAPGREPLPGRNGLTVGTFNNATKISDHTVEVWSGLLQSSPDLTLVLKDRRYAKDDYRAAFLARFRARGVDAERIVLLDRFASDAEHLAAYAKLDIALDTFPYCGVTTTCEALWMGVPVVTLAGATSVSRMGASLLTAVGHPEWIASSADEYVATVLALAADPAHLRHLRVTLRGQMQASPLMDEAGITRDVEDAYRDIWSRWCSAQGMSRSAAITMGQDSLAA
jgi:predicted O-linked N-acetylglucosamine transferase (SPINDLY family)